MKKLQFFARKPFNGNAYPRVTDGTTIWRLSSVIRGEQIAQYLGADYNQPRDENALGIFVKPLTLDQVKDGDYVDYCDQNQFIELGQKLIARPKIKVIGIAEFATEHLKKILPNEIVCIPQQHLNWENFVNPKRKLTAGYIGRPSNTSNKINTDIKETLKKIGIDFIVCYKWETRQDAIDFYKKIDLLILSEEGLESYDSPFRTPTKMINAASFGIPSIAYRIKGYKEFEGYYTPFKGLSELTTEVNKFKNEAYYADFSKKILEKAKEYHISEVAKKYLAL